VALRRNGLGGRHSALLAALLVALRAVALVDLSHNPIGDRGMVAVLSGLISSRLPEGPPAGPLTSTLVLRGCGLTELSTSGLLAFLAAARAPRGPRLCLSGLACIDLRGAPAAGEGPRGLLKVDPETEFRIQRKAAALPGLTLLLPRRFHTPAVGVTARPTAPGGPRREGSLALPAPQPNAAPGAAFLRYRAPAPAPGQPSATEEMTARLLDILIGQEEGHVRNTEGLVDLCRALSEKVNPPVLPRPAGPPPRRPSPPWPRPDRTPLSCSPPCWRSPARPTSGRAPSPGPSRRSGPCGRTSRWAPPALPARDLQARIDEATGSLGALGGENVERGERQSALEADLAAELGALRRHNEGLAKATIRYDHMRERLLAVGPK